LTNAAEDLIRRGIPYGYYLMGRMLEEIDGSDEAPIFFRKAADLGSPDAQ